MPLPTRPFTRYLIGQRVIPSPGERWIRVPPDRRRLGSGGCSLQSPDEERIRTARTTTRCATTGRRIYAEAMLGSERLHDLRPA